MSDLDDYVDVRALMDNYQQLPCRECGNVEWYNPHFCYNHDEGLCDTCGPDIDHLIDNRIEVRL